MAFPGFMHGMATVVVAAAAVPAIFSAIVSAIVSATALGAAIGSEPMPTGTPPLLQRSSEEEARAAASAGVWAALSV
jgi:hypothetical protein